MLGAGLSMERSGDAATVTAGEAQHEGGGRETEVFGCIGVRPSDNSSDDQDKGEDAGKGEEGDKGSGGGGNRWPRQETLALLKIRLDMDASFRDSSLKGPLWEEVARKLAQLGHKRSAKKCKEKFENVYKYHKRTKQGRSGKPEGKTYKFFDELQALENQFSVSQTKQQPSLATSELVDRRNTESEKLSRVISPPSSLPAPGNPTVAVSSAATMTTMNSRIPPALNSYLSPGLDMSAEAFRGASTSSSTASDEGLEERYRRKRKWKDYFRRLTRKLTAKQEEMQKRFLEAMDRRDQERMAREEVWRNQEMGRINREHEILVRERSTAAAKDAAVIAFLQKISGHRNIPPCSQSQSAPSSEPQQRIQPQQPWEAAAGPAKVENGDCGGPASSSRWPKTEVQALITLRADLDSRYHDNAPKGPLWEEISEGMRKLGYYRTAKKCKEKWENINKYFKKVKESNKQRPEDSKTCPYFHQLEAIYREKKKTSSENSSFSDMAKENHSLTEPLTVQPEQQWRPPPQDPPQLPPPPLFRDETDRYLYQNKETEQDIEDEYGEANDDDDHDPPADEDPMEHEGLRGYEME